MRVASFFTGIGGFDLGFERSGMKVVFQCEIDPFCQKILKRHWPCVPIHQKFGWKPGSSRTALHLLECLGII
ncbi:DNA cytosine methyltransferase [Microseira sp. BLCC-F43]|uniref:DNA cytosine methyltransferase n=1 Tax=Microseira sp. BLCC-F43 TaxID=3153602 RepID=UPI0035BB914B